MIPTVKVKVEWTPDGLEPPVSWLKTRLAGYKSPISSNNISELSFWKKYV